MLGDFGDEGDPIVVGDEDDVDTRWLGLVEWLSKDSTRAAVAILVESCRLLIAPLFPSMASLVPS